jgi:hypothetical protein
MTHEELEKIPQQIAELQRQVSELQIVQCVMDDENRAIVQWVLGRVRFRGDKAIQERVVYARAVELDRELQVLKEDYPAVFERMEKERML